LNFKLYFTEDPWLINVDMGIAKEKIGCCDTQYSSEIESCGYFY
jgi:hypothetical protein